jgi:spermidine synthase
VRQLQTLFPFVQITAVEIDPVHIELAELHFDVDTGRAKIFQESAEAFIAGYRGPKFDLIIDDLFSGTAGIPHRAVKCSGFWLTRLEKCLMPEGSLAINFADFAELKESAVFKRLKNGSRFKSGFELRSPTNENVIAILMSGSMHSADLRRHLSETPVLSKALEKRQLRYQARRLRV